MKKTLKTLLLALLAVSFTACGGSEPPQEEEEDIIECGEDTRLEGSTCVPDVECAEGEVALSDGRCVRADYCGEGTQFNPDTGRCVSNINLVCGPNTEPNEDGECLPEFVTTCGEGTVVADGECRLHDDVCGDGTTVGGPQQCRPSPDVCGEGTAFDTTNQVCVPLSNLTCGSGTLNVEGVCQPARAFFEALADDPDLDLTATGAGEATLQDVGERYVFTGNIAAPEFVDGEPVQDEDVLTFSAAAGQWVRLGVYSLGLPEPGFLLESEGDYFRLSDLGAGLEVFREVAIPSTGTYTMTISNMPQILGNLGPAGGEDWDYVGYLEVVDPPEAEEVELPNASMSGNVRNLMDNLYHVTGTEEGAGLAFVFTSLPHSADAEIQVWTDLETLVDVVPLQGSSVSLTAPADEFYLLVDREYGYGAQVSYGADILAGEQLADGASMTMDVELDANQYVGVSQFNLSGAALSARILDGATELSTISELASWDQVLGQISLYAFSPTATTVTVELTNNTGSDLGFFTTDLRVETAEDLGEFEEELSFSTNVNIPERHAHFMTFESTVEDLVILSLSGTANALVTLFDGSGNTVGQGANQVIAELEEGLYLVRFDAQTNMTAGFQGSMEVTDVYEDDVEATTSYSPSIDVSTTYASTLDMGPCSSILDISVSVDLSASFASEIYIDLVGPSGTSVALRSGTSGTHQTTYPDQTAPAQSLDAFLGEVGQGEWQLEVANQPPGGFLPGSANLSSWTVHLFCLIGG